MPVSAPCEGYTKMIAYGHKKSKLRYDQLALQSFMAGFWVAVYGHCCTVFASQFHNHDQYSTGLTKLAYGSLFPGAFVAVVYTGTELFTGNTVTMIMLCFNDKGKSWKHLVKVWSFSLIGNYIGAAFGAVLISYLSGVFREGKTREYLFYAATKKIGAGFGENVILGIGCNLLVCLATWCTVCSDDGAGKILAIWFSVAVFSIGGFEHVVANFYTLTAASLCGLETYNYGDAVVYNFIPVLIGNLLAGTILTGTMWWYALHPSANELSPYTNNELIRELTQRIGSASAADMSWDETALQWKGNNINNIPPTSYLKTPTSTPNRGRSPTAETTREYSTGVTQI